MLIIPSKKKIISLSEVSGYKGKRTHKVFIGNYNGKTEKFTIERSRLKALFLSVVSRIVLKSKLNTRIQLVTHRRGLRTRQNYFDGTVLEKSQKLNNAQVVQLSELLSQLHNAPVPFIFRPLAKMDFHKRVNFVSNTLLKLGILSKSEINDCVAFFENIPSATKAICHNDVRSENLLEGKNGLVLIDPGDMTVGLKEAEIAKTIVFENFGAEQQKLFLDSYLLSGGNLDLFNKHKKFWMAFALFNGLSWTARNLLTSSEEQAQRIAELKSELLKIVK